MKPENAKKCESCEFCGEYTANKYKVCWLITDDEVMYIDDIPGDYECEDYRQRGKKNEQTDRTTESARNYCKRR